MKFYAEIKAKFTEEETLALKEALRIITPDNFNCEGIDCRLCPFNDETEKLYHCAIAGCTKDLKYILSNIEK